MEFIIDLHVNRVTHEGLTGRKIPYGWFLTENRWHVEKQVTARIEEAWQVSFPGECDPGHCTVIARWRAHTHIQSSATNG
jgi:hypothetical protein